jgi:oligopeptide/dipeptide ABC transporter ATP-binding protein
MGPPLLRADQVSREYPAPGMVRRGRVTAVDGVSLEVRAGQCLGVVGESGSGKSTLARILLALERPDAGTVWLDSWPISRLPAHRLRPLRRRFQAVFQDPLDSLNPWLRVATIIAEPLVAHGLGDRTARRLRVSRLLAMVGLDEEVASRRPSALSGGERQRVAIARALAPQPELMVLDEPVSSLDVSVQATILELLGHLQTTLGLAMVFISHDLEVVVELCDTVAVMHGGRLVEQGATGEVFRAPAHPHSVALLEAGRGVRQGGSVPAESLPRASWPAGSCRYAARCPRAADACREEPQLVSLSDDHRVACWFPSGE